MNYLISTDIKRNFFLITISGIIFLNFFATCKKAECIGNAYSLKETWKITPEKDSINIGDTIIFTSTFSNNPYDYNSKSNVNFSGKINVGTPFAIRSIMGYNNLVDAVDSFTTFLISGSYKLNDKVPKRIIDIAWIETNNNVSISFGIIARKKGDYVFTVPDAIGNIRGENTCQNGIGISLTNSNIDNNIELNYPYYGGSNVPLNENLHAYCIRVK